ncbi:MAG: LemA family protein [Bacteroidota bacterium]
MSRGLIIILVVAALFVFWGISINNNLATKTQNVKAQWGDIQSAYQRRADLIPNLVNTVKGVANFEKGTLTDVIAARASATQMKISADDLSPENIAKYQAAQSSLSGALGRLMVVSEQYPQLKATQNFSELQAQIEGTENRINVERNKFNDTVRDYNGDLVRFPASFIARMLGYSEKGYIEGDKGSEKAPTVDFGEAK